MISSTMIASQEYASTLIIHIIALMSQWEKIHENLVASFVNKSAMCWIQATFSDLTIFYSNPPTFGF